MRSSYLIRSWLLTEIPFRSLGWNVYVLFMNTHTVCSSWYTWTTWSQQIRSSCSHDAHFLFVKASLSCFLVKHRQVDMLYTCTRFHFLPSPCFTGFKGWQSVRRRIPPCRPAEMNNPGPASGFGFNSCSHKHLWIYSWERLSERSLKFAKAISPASSLSLWSCQHPFHSHPASMWPL